MTSRGIIYVATNDDRYIEEAVLAAESAKRWWPDLSVTLFTDRPQNPLTRSGYFDMVERMPRGPTSDWANGLLSRIACLSRTPYSDTLHLDTDTRVLTPNLPRLFDVLRNQDVGMVEDAATYSFACSHSARRQFNGGLILYRLSEQTLRCWREWAKRFQHNLDLSTSNPTPPVPGVPQATDQETRRRLLRTDQIALMEILSPDRNAFDLKIAALDDTWNFRGSPAKPGTNIHHSPEYKQDTLGNILALAHEADSTGETTRGRLLYDYVAKKYLEERRPRSWKWWQRKPEEWRSDTLRNADLHMQYDQPERAIALFDKTLEADSRNPYAIAGHARLGLRLRQNEAALGLAEEVLRRLPRSAYAKTIYGAALVVAGRTADAIAPLRDAAAKKNAAAAFQLGQALFQMRNYAAAAESYLESLKIEPGHAAAANNVVPALLGAGRYEDAIAQADRILAKQSWHVSALAFKAAALANLEKQAEERSMIDLERLVKIETLTAPVGYGSLEEFNGAVARLLAKEPSLRREPQEHATRRGQHSGDLAQNQSSAIIALNDQIIAAVDRRRTETDDASSHPFDRTTPQTYRLASWTVIMEEGGHQIPHIHAKGWLSGVYYVEVPDDVREDDPDRSGWITFGPSEDRWRRTQTKSVELSICPRPGMLITFPSFFWHGTRPLRSNARRISYAFDVIPL